MTDHRCLAGNTCRGAVRVDDPTTGETARHAAIIDQEHGLCDACRGQVEHTVNDLTETWLALHLAIGDSTRRNGQKVMSSRSAPINLNTDADALKVAITEWVVAAAARVCEPLNIDEPQPRNNTDLEHASVITQCVRILAPNIDLLLEQPADDVMVWLTSAETQYPGERLYIDEHGIPHAGLGVKAMTGPEIALKLIDLRKKSRAFLALTTPLDKLSLPCPRCNEHELTRTHRTINSLNGSKEIDEIDCGACNLNWPYTQYQNLCSIWVKRDEMEREKLQRQLDAEKDRRERAEFRLAKLDWWLALAVDWPDISASAFAATVLADPEEPDPDAYLSDKDVANLVGVSDSTIRGWASKGVIGRHTAGDGAVVFSASEVWEYAKANPQPRAATVRRLNTSRRLNEAECG